MEKNYTYQELRDYVDVLNESTTNKHKVTNLNNRIDTWLKLYINDKFITEGDIFDITDRVWQIIRENGLQWNF